MGWPDPIIWIAFGAAQWADVITTRRGLDLGLREMNPIWRWFQERLGRAWWVPRVVGSFVIAGGLAWAFASLVPVAVMAGGIALVAANNWRLTRKTGAS